MKISDDNKERQRMKQAALEKLLPSERKLFDC